MRGGGIEDAPAIQQLLGSIYKSVYGPLIGPDRADALHAKWHAQDVLAGQANAVRSSFLVEERDGAIIAHAFGSAARRPILFVVRLYVVPSYQARGIGSALLAELTRRHPDAELARLFVVKGNSMALDFWRRRGFTVAGEASEDGVVSLRMEPPAPALTVRCRARPGRRRPRAPG